VVKSIAALFAEREPFDHASIGAALDPTGRVRQRDGFDR